MMSPYSLFVSIFGAATLFLGGLVAWDYLQQDLHRGGDLTFSTYLSEVPDRIVPLHRPQAERALITYLPVAPAGWDVWDYQREDQLLLLPPGDRSGPNARQRLSRLELTVGLRNQVVYDQTERVTLTYSDGRDVTLVNLVWEEAQRSKGISGFLLNGMQDGRRANLDDRPIYADVRGWAFHDVPFSQLAATRLDAQMGRQITLRVVSTLPDPALLTFLGQLDVEGLNNRLDRPLDGISNEKAVLLAGREH